MPAAQTQFTADTTTTTTITRRQIFQRGGPYTLLSFRAVHEDTTHPLLFRTPAQLCDDDDDDDDDCLQIVLFFAVYTPQRR